ncbi:MAG: tetratricopeptide repeat protein [Campylobacteraceae bacterium]
MKKIFKAFMILPFVLFLLKADVKVEDECSKSVIDGYFENDKLEQFNKPFEEKKYTKQLQKCCDKNNKEACNRLARNIHLYKGYKDAMPTYQKACDLEEVNSCVFLGQIYVSKEDESSYKQAAIYFSKACKLKDINSCSATGNIYENNLDNPQKAVDSYEVGCELNDERFCFDMARVYIKNEKKLNVSEKVFMDLCEKKASNACFYLGWKYKNIDFEKSLKLYEKACKYENSSGCMELAKYYESTKNIEKAKEYYNLACSLLLSDGCENAKRLYKTK